VRSPEVELDAARRSYRSAVARSEALLRDHELAFAELCDRLDLARKRLAAAGYVTDSTAASRPTTRATSA
jgi:hypothetical protein